MSVRVCIINNMTVGRDITAASFFGKGELERIAQMTNEKRRRESIGALIALKKAFGSDRTTEIVRQSLGRPCFESDVHADLGLSHSARLSAAALVFGEGRKVGIDVERIDERLFAKDSLKYLGIASRYFSDKEKERLERAEGESCLRDEFYRIWTSKEAASKLSGEGISKIRAIDVTDAMRSEHHFLSYKAHLDGDKYIITVCSNRREDVEMLCDNDIRISLMR